MMTLLAAYRCSMASRDVFRTGSPFDPIRKGAYVNGNQSTNRGGFPIPSFPRWAVPTEVGFFVTGFVVRISPSIGDEHKPFATGNRVPNALIPNATDVVLRLLV